MEKNVGVIDENQNDYGATWYKRARGLVKKGRARWISDDTICLTRPPDTKNTEEITMTDTQSENIIAVEPTKAVNDPENRMNLGYVLSQIDRISRETDHIRNALQNLDGVASGAGPGDIAGAAKAEAIADVVKCRETTNQKLIEFYTKMYDDLRPVTKDNVAETLMYLAKDENPSDDEFLDYRLSLMKTLTDILNKLN